MSTETIRPGRIPPEAYPRFMAAVVDYAMFFLDPEGHISSWNEGARRAKGYEEKEILGKHFSVFYPAADVEAKKPQYELRVAAAEGRFEDEGWRVRKDGTMFWANVVITAVKDSDGHLMGFAKVTRDLTARRHAENALRESEERYRLVTQSVKDYAIILLDPAGRIVSWNEGARRLNGYEADEIIGEHFSRFYTKADIERHHPAHELEMALREGRFEEEGWRVRKDSSLYWASVTITPLRDSSGRSVGFAKVTRDLTVKKRAEEELRERASSYAALNRELDAFSHTVAHDLRSPIRAVEHLSSVLLDEERGSISAPGRQNLEALHATSVRMARLVQDLLDLSAASGREPKRVEIDLTKLASEVGEEARRREPEREIEVRVQSGLVADADPQLLRVAMTNLVGNAVKFTRRTARALVEVGQEATPAGPAFFVRDNGVGFDPDRAPHLFQPFSRLHPQNEFEGTGIGLATVERIARRHGGKVWARASPGGGATFYFTLAPVPT